MPGRAIHARDDFVDRLHAGSTTKVQSGDFSIRDLFVLRLASPNHELLTVGRAVVARAANRGQRLLSRVIIVRFDGHRTSVLVAFDGRAFDFLDGGELKLEALDDQKLAEVWAGQKEIEHLPNTTGRMPALRAAGAVFFLRHSNFYVF